MYMEIAVGKQLDGNRTELIYKNQLPNRKADIKYYTVPTEKQAEFVSQFTKQHKRNGIASLVVYFGSAIGAAMFAGKLSKKFFPSLLYSLAGSILGAVLSSQAINIYSKASEQKLFEKFDLREQGPDNNVKTEASEK